MDCECNVNLIDCKVKMWIKWNWNVSVIQMKCEYYINMKCECYINEMWMLYKWNVNIIQMKCECHIN